MGAAGVGWNLYLPSIVRKGAAAMPQFVDEVLFPGNNLAGDARADEYQIDGVSLVPVCVISGGACSQAPGETFGGSFLSDGWVYFRREIDDGVRYFFAPNGQSWVAQTQSGDTITYGAPFDNVVAGAYAEIVDAGTLSQAAPTSTAPGGIARQPTLDARRPLLDRIDQRQSPLGLRP